MSENRIVFYFLLWDFSDHCLVDACWAE